MSPTAQTEMEQVELTIEDAQKLIDRRDSLLKLQNNRDFKKIINEGFLKEEAVRLVHALADPNLAQFREQIQGSIEGIGVLLQYFHTITAMGNAAENEMREHQELLNELQNEELD